MSKDVGDYRLEELIGFGGGGEVWRARHRGSGDAVALKRLRGGDPERRERQLREGGLLAAVSHPHLGALREVLYEPGETVLVLEFYAGGSLAALLARRRRLRPGEVVSILAPVAAALAYAHDEGLVHADLSPGNILFTAGGRPVLTDLGVARVLADEADVHATPEYVDPLVARGGAPTAASDVFGLAAVAFHLLTGIPPWNAAGAAATTAVAATAVLPDLRMLAPGLPPELLGVVERGLSIEPELRGSAAEFALDLRHACPPEAVAFEVDAHGVPRPPARGGPVTQAVRPPPTAGPVPAGPHDAVPGDAVPGDPRGSRSGRRGGPARPGPGARPGPPAGPRRTDGSGGTARHAGRSRPGRDRRAAGRARRGRSVGAVAGRAAVVGGRGALAVLLVVAAIVVAAAAGVRWSGGDAAPAVAARPAATPTAPTSAGELEFAVPDSPVGWAPVLAGLYERRAMAFEQADPEALAAVYTATSPQATGDRREIQRLAAAGLRTDGFAPEVLSVVRADWRAPTVTLLVLDQFGPYAVVGEGAVVSSHAGRAAASVEVRLRLTDVGWRIDSAVRVPPEG